MPKLSKVAANLRRNDQPAVSYKGNCARCGRGSFSLTKSKRDGYCCPECMTPRCRRCDGTGWLSRIDPCGTCSGTGKVST